MENLIIATTPLQAKIVNYIVGLYAGEKFLKVYLTPVMNERQEYYSRDFYLVFHGIDEATYEQVLDACAKEYDKIFYASFDNQLILDIVARSKYNHLMSFDDGYANIYPRGMYALPLDYRQVGKYGLTRDDLINNTEKHYTLYDSDFHVVAKEKLVYLEDFFKLDIEPVKNGKTLFKEYEFVEVYHFTSSVSLHLKDVHNVIVKGIEIPYYNERQNELRKFGLKFINVTLGW